MRRRLDATRRDALGLGKSVGFSWCYNGTKIGSGSRTGVPERRCDVKKSESVSGGSMEKDAIERNRSSLLDFFVFGG